MAGNDSYTKSLLHMDGYDGSVIFTDNAFGGSHTWTANGNAQIDTAQYRLGLASGLFDGTSDFIQTPYSSDFDFGSGDFTWDFWVRWNTLPTAGNNQALITVGRIADANNLNVLYLNNTGGTYRPYFLAIVGGVTQAQYYKTTGLGVSAAVWYHWALVRNGTSLFFFQDGVSQALTAGTAISTNSITPAVNEAVTIARYGSDVTYDFNGWLDEIRISTGIARWTANFSLPISGYYDMVGKLAADTVRHRWQLVGSSRFGYYPAITSFATDPVNGVISGVVKRNGSPVANAWVRLYYRPTGEFICQIKSGSDGAFSFSPASTIWSPLGAGVGLNPSDSENYLVMAIDPQNSLNIKGYDMVTAV